MLTCSCSSTSTMLPLVLLNKKLGRNIWVLLLVGILMNFGRIVESFIVISTSFQIDGFSFMRFEEIQTIIKGITLGLVMISLDYFLLNSGVTFTGKNVILRINYKPILVVLFSVIIYCIGSWLTSIYPLTLLTATA